MTTPGVTVRPIQLIDGGHEVNEVLFEDVRVPVENLVGEENKGWDYAKFLLGNERVGVAPVGATKRVLAQAKEYAGRPSAGSLLDDPLSAARIAELENELLALELTALRVVAHSADGKPHPASSVLKLKGTELQQAVSELVVDLAGPASLAVRRRRRLRPAPGWAPASDAGLPQPPQGLDLRRLQRGPAADHRQHDPGTLRGTTWTSPTTRSSRRCARPSAACSARRTPTSRTAAGPWPTDPGFDEKLWSGSPRWACSGCRSPRRTAAWAPARSRSASSPQELGRVLAPEPFLDVGGAGRRPGRRGRHRRAADRAARRPRVRRAACSPSRTPSPALAGPRRAPRSRPRVRRRLDAVRRQGAGARTAPAPTCSSSAPRWPTAAPACSWSQPTPPALSRTGYPTHDGGRAARVAFDDDPGRPARRRPGDATAAIAAALDAAPHRRRQRGARRDGGRADATIGRTSRAASSSASPLNTFQALTFRAADMYVSLELARSIVALGDDGAGRRLGRRGRRGRLARGAAGQPGRPAHRPGGDPAARRHRR